jgi:hypothetical protein
MFKFSQNRLLFQWPSKYARTVYQKYRENTGKYRGKYRDCIPKIPESHRNHSGEQIVIHHGRKSVTVSGNKKVWILFSKTPKNVWVKNKQKFFAGFLGDFYMFAVISICVGV